MNMLVEHWEKIVLGVVVVLVAAVLALSFAGGRDAQEFVSRKGASDIPGTNVAGCYAVVVECAEGGAAASLDPNSFSHPWLQYCTACKKLQPRFCRTCPECGATVNYKADSDGDGMENKWEQKYGLDWTSAADANEDPDADGLTNLEEFERNSNPNDPTDPNVVLDEYTIVQVSRPVRPIMLMRCTELKSGVNLQLKYKGRTQFKKEGQTIDEGKTPVFRVGKVTIKKEGVWNPMISATQYVDKSEVTMTDLKTGNSFTAVLCATNYEDYVEAKFTGKEDGKSIVCREGDELPLEKLKTKAKIIAINEQDKSCTFDVDKRKYTAKAER